MNQITIKTPQSDYLEMVNVLISRTPTDKNGLLTYFIDFDYIPDDILIRESSEQKELIGAAKIPLSMVEGYLAFDNVKPIWDQLPQEPAHLYDVFRNFLLMPNRNLHQLMERIPAFTSMQMIDTYTIYYWEFRGKVYDIHKPIAASKVRNQRILMLEDQDFIIAESLQNQILQEIAYRTAELKKDNPDNIGRPFEDVHPTHLLKMMQDMVELKRVSARLPARGPATIQQEDYLSSNISSDATLTQRVKEFNGESDNNDKSSVVEERLSKNIAGNPKLLEELQEIAIKAMYNNGDNNDK